MQHIENVFSFMTWSDRCGLDVFVVDGDDEDRYELGVTRLCWM